MAENTLIATSSSFTLPRTNTKQMQQQQHHHHQQQQQQQQQPQQSNFKRKLEKIKTKIAEFFFLSTKSSASSNEKESTSVYSKEPVILFNKDTLNLSNATCNTSNNNTLNGNNSNSLVLSPFYYGYKTQTNDDIIESINDYKVPAICDEDELQENFCDRNFMIDYISSQIICQLKQSFLLQSFGLDLRLPIDFNLLCEISNDIYTQSECEPCGLKGCKLTIEIAINESLNKHIEKYEYSKQKQQQVQQQSNRYYATVRNYNPVNMYQLPLTRTLASFRFDTSSTLNTFELRLILKEDLNSSSWLRRMLPKTKIFEKLRTQNAIYLGSSYDLIKRQLY